MNRFFKFLLGGLVSAVAVCCCCIAKSNVYAYSIVNTTSSNVINFNHKVVKDGFTKSYQYYSQTNSYNQHFDYFSINGTYSGSSNSGIICTSVSYAVVNASSSVIGSNFVNLSDYSTEVITIPYSEALDFRYFEFKLTNDMNSDRKLSNHYLVIQFNNVVESSSMQMPNYFLSQYHVSGYNSNIPDRYDEGYELGYTSGYTSGLADSSIFNNYFKDKIAYLVDYHNPNNILSSLVIDNHYIDVEQLYTNGIAWDLYNSLDESELSEDGYYYIDIDLNLPLNLCNFVLLKNSNIIDTNLIFFLDDNSILSYSTDSFGENSYVVVADNTNANSNLIVEKIRFDVRAEDYFTKSLSSLAYFDSYDLGFNAGQSNGYSNGYTSGYDYGYSKGKTDGLSFSYDVGYEDGYDEGYEVGLEDGAESGDGGIALVKVIKLVPDTFVNSFKTMVNFDFLGINIFDFICSIFTLLLIAKIIKMFI